MSTVRASFTFDLGVRGHAQQYLDYHDTTVPKVEGILSSGLADGFVDFTKEDGTVVLHPVSRILKIELKEL